MPSQFVGRQFVCKIIASAETTRCVALMASLSLAPLLMADEATELLRHQYDRSVYFGTQYEYEVSYVHVTDNTQLSTFGKGVAEGRRRLLIGAYAPDSWAIPYRIEHYWDGHNEPYLEPGDALMNFGAFDGTMTTQFNRNLLGEGGPLVEHACYVSAGAEGTLLHSDPFVISLMVLTGELNRFGGSPIAFSKGTEELVVSKASDPEIDNLLRIKDPKTSFELTMTGKPEYMVTSASFIDFQVQEIVEVDGIRYPSQGYYDAGAWRATYKLISASPIAGEIGDWSLEWPSAAGRKHGCLNRLVSPRSKQGHQSARTFPV